MPQILPTRIQRQTLLDQKLISYRYLSCSPCSCCSSCWGDRLQKKTRAPSFVQIRSGWNLAGLFFN